MTASTTFPAPRVLPNAAHAFGGIWRLTVRRFFTPGHWLVLAGMLVLLALFSLASLGSGTRLHAYPGWASHFYVGFLVPILAFINAAGVVRDDLKSESVDYVFTRPVRRPLFLAFRYVAHVACAQIDFLFALAVVVAVGSFRGVPDLWAAVPLLLLAQVVTISVFSAFGFLCGTLTSRYVIIGLAYGLIVEVGIGNVPTQLSRVSILQHVLGILRPLTVGAPSEDMPRALAGPLSTPAALTLLLTMSLAMLAVSSALFSLKELAGEPGRDA